MASPVFCPQLQVSRVPSSTYDGYGFGAPLHYNNYYGIDKKQMENENFIFFYESTIGENEFLQHPPDSEFIFSKWIWMKFFFKEKVVEQNPRCIRVGSQFA